MSRETYDLMIGDHVEWTFGDSKTNQFIETRHAKYLKEEYPPVSGKGKEIKELCNVLLAYGDAISDAQTKGLDVKDEDFGNMVYSVLREIAGFDDY